jgi:hypothetical protein
MFIAVFIHNSQAMENNQDTPLLMNGPRKCGVYTHGILLSHKEE